MIEISSIIFSIIFVYLLYKNQKKWNYLYLKFFLSAMIYSFVFEFLNSNISWSYHYIKYSLWIFWIPLYVILIRSSLLTYTIYILINIKNKITDKNIGSGIFRLSLIGSFWVLSLDISVDIVAVIQKLRTRNITTQQWRFWINYANYFWRFIVSFVFIYFFLKQYFDNKWKINLSFWIKLIIKSLILQSIILLSPLLFLKINPQTQKFSYFFLIVITIIFFYSKKFEILKKWVRDKLTLASNIFFVIVHWYCMLYLFFYKFFLPSFISSMFFITSLFFLVEEILYFKKQNVNWQN